MEDIRTDHATSGTEHRPDQAPGTDASPEPQRRRIGPESKVRGGPGGYRRSSARRRKRPLRSRQAMTLEPVGPPEARDKKAPPVALEGDDAFALRVIGRRHRPGFGSVCAAAARLPRGSSPKAALRYLQSGRDG